MANPALTEENMQAAHAVAVDLHKRAFLGRLAQLGFQPQTEKEAEALLDLGMSLAQEGMNQDPIEKAAGADQFDYGRGPFATAKAAYDRLTSVNAPGFEQIHGAAPTWFGTKQASVSDGPQLPELPPALRDSSYAIARELAKTPEVYKAAVVKRAQTEAMLAQLMAAQATADTE